MPEGTLRVTEEISSSTTRHWKASATTASKKVSVSSTKKVADPRGLAPRMLRWSP